MFCCFTKITNKSFQVTKPTVIFDIKIMSIHEDAILELPQNVIFILLNVFSYRVKPCIYSHEFLIAFQNNLWFSFLGKGSS